VIGNVDEDFTGMLLLFLESTTKFCGGDIRMHVYVSDENKLFVTYEDAKVADRVVNHGKFTVGSREFIARFYVDDEPGAREAKKPKMPFK
jgi:hypothetical protein